MNVLLVDDHELVWRGTQRLLADLAHELQPQGEFVFQAVASAEAACALEVPHLDLVLLDYHLPGSSGVEALKALQARFEGVPICMVSAESAGTHVRELLDAGAAGFIPKSYRASEIASALKQMMRDGIYVPAEFMFAEEMVRPASADDLASRELAVFIAEELSPRQKQVLKLALRGLPNKTIARQLQLAEGTVKVHLSMVYRALGVKNRVGALCRVLQADAAHALN